MTFPSPPSAEPVKPAKGHDAGDPTTSRPATDTAKTSASSTTSTGPTRERNPGMLTFAPSARVLRRSQHEIQIERGGRAVIVSNLPETVLARLAGRHHPAGTGSTAGTASTADTVSTADTASATGAVGAVAGEVGAAGAVADDEADEAEINRVLRMLVSAGYLAPTAAGGPASRPVTAREAALLPDLLSLDDRFGARAATVLERRSYRYVRIHGTGRLAPLVAALLAASGVGRVLAPDSADVSVSDAVPGGLRPEDEGQRTATAVADAIRRARPGSAAATSYSEVADLLIAAEGHPVRPQLRAVLHSERGPHLIAGVWGSSAVVGPLVVPGLTSCLTCADLHRSDRDPAWPVLASQLTGSAQRSTPSEVAVCALTAAMTAVQALAFLDGERPATFDGTLEFRLPDWRVRRRHWSRHSECSCAA